MINLSLNELNLIAKSRSIKDYKNKSKEDLIKIFSRPKPRISLFKKKIEEIITNFSELRHMFFKPKTNLFKKKIKQIIKDFSELRHAFSKSKRNEFIRSLYNIKIKKHVFTPETKKSNQGVRVLGNLIGEVDEDNYKPIKTKSVFNGNYTEYKSKGVKDKNLLLKKYLDFIDTFNDT